MIFSPFALFSYKKEMWKACMLSLSQKRQWEKKSQPIQFVLIFVLSPSSINFIERFFIIRLVSLLELCNNDVQKGGNIFIFPFCWKSGILKISQHSLKTLVNFGENFSEPTKLPFTYFQNQIKSHPKFALVDYMPGTIQTTTISFFITVLTFFVRRGDLDLDIVAGYRKSFYNFIIKELHH